MLCNFRWRLGSLILTILLTATNINSQIIVTNENESNTSAINFPIHGSDILWKQELEVRKFLDHNPEAMKSTALKKRSAWNFNVGDSKTWYADNLTDYTRYQVPSTCRAVGTNCYIFVENTSWSSGKVNQSAVDSMRAYFDSKTPANPTKGIYQINTETFGFPPDVDNDPKIIILLLDIIDGYTGTGGYVVGYFYSFNQINPSQPGYSTSNFAEIFFIDTNPQNLTTTNGLMNGVSTLAHEFQHMIHFNYDRNEITFINEGCSLISEVTCGFPIYNPTLYASEPNQSLFNWRRSDMTKVLNDYSRAARFALYIRDQAGIGVFKNIVASTLIGADGINAGLQASGSSLRFTDILQNWFIANVLDDRNIDTRYGYIYPNLPKCSDIIFYDPNVTLSNSIVENYAVRYISFKNGSQLKATFTVSNPSLIIKAIEIGQSDKRVLNVTNAVEFSEPEFGNRYTEIHFAIMNLNANSPYSFTYQTSGQSKSIELRYDYTEPIGVYPLAANDTVCVIFNAVPEGRLDSIRVGVRRNSAIRGGIWKSSGVVRPSPLGEPLALNLTTTGLSTPSVPYPVPWPNWATIDLRSRNISTNTPFAVGFIMDGAYAGTNNNYVMATHGPLGNGPTSFTYSSGSSSGPNWYYYTINSTGDSIVYYLVRAYVSFPLAVYPGDANSDGIVDERDILPIGQYYGKTGAVRIGRSIAWNKQFISQQWIPLPACHADCDGNGVVDSNDVIAIIQNWKATISGGVPTGYIQSAICLELIQEIDKNYPSEPMLAIRNAISAYLNNLKNEESNFLPTKLILNQNYPNPFNPSTSISYQLSKNSNVVLKVYDLLGREIATLINEFQQAGKYSVTFNASNSMQPMPTGVYFYRMTAGTISETKRMILIK